MRILNLGCGTKVSANADIVNIDWSMYLRMKGNLFLRRLAPLILSGERLDRFNRLPDNIMLCNLAKGIPFESNSVDAVYHSHLFEHLDRNIAGHFLDEILRVLKPGGFVRIVLPDLEKLCRDYLVHIPLALENRVERQRHDEYIAQIIEQSVRKEAFGAQQQPPIRRWLENRVLGDARKRGETHQWMYDRVSLSTLLSDHGFIDIEVKRYDESSIPNWQMYCLDINESGEEYKPGSLYIEGRKIEEKQEMN